MTSLQGFDVLGYINGAAGLPEYTEHFKSVTVPQVAAAFELMLSSGDYATSDAIQKLFGIAGEESNSNQVQLINAISFARVLYDEYRVSVRSNPGAETVPLLVYVNYEYNKNYAGLQTAKATGFTVTWLQKPVDPSAIRQGLRDVLAESQLNLSARASGDSAVVVTVGSTPGLLTGEAMADLANSLLDGKGYEYSFIDLEGQAIAQAETLASTSFTELFEGVAAE